LHLLLGSQSQLVILLDLGIYYDSKVVRHITGYGVGVQLSTGRGPLKLILAGHEGLGLRNSFLHIEYSGRVSWIDQ
ncbi:MAG: hypothetical protein U9Q77_12115, partial [Candidatus Marinimicrobia bacterium]|nr:hypothetical protein [Candidatus Neomarinimicrobiota bacterium]